MTRPARATFVFALIMVAGCADSTTGPVIQLERPAFAAAPCAGEVRLTTQSDVDAFSCSSISDALYIGPSSGPDAITNLAALSVLTSVGGPVFIWNNESLADVDGLSSLASTRTLQVSGNATLQDLDGLSGLTSSTGVQIYENDLLTSIDGLSSMSTAAGSAIVIRDNASLIDVDGLAGISEPASRVEISNNTSLMNLDGLSGLTGMTGNLEIEDNPVLANVNGLSGLSGTIGLLSILRCPGLVDIDALSGLTALGALDIGENDNLADIDGLSNVASVGFFLGIHDNAALTNVDGLSSLVSVVHVFSIMSNPVLSNLDGLSSLRTVTNRLLIESNDALTSVAGLSGLETVTSDFSLQHNHALEECACDLYALLAGGVVGGTVTIADNGPGCSAIGDITAAACAACTSSALQSLITDLVASGMLRSSHGQALLNKLDSAEKQAAKGNIADAIAKLDAFLSQVADLEAGGEISPATADLLRTSAQALRAAYEAIV